MSALEYTIVGIKKGWRISRTFLFCGAFAAMLVNGVFGSAGADPSNKYLAIAAFLLWAAAFGTLAHRRFFGLPLTSFHAKRIDLELGLLLILITYAGIQLAGGLQSQYYPALLILIAFLVVYTPQWVGFSLVACAIGLEYAMAWLSPQSQSLFSVSVHAVFIALFAVINLVFTRTEVARMRHKAKERIEALKKQMLHDAQSFRLTAATSDTVRGTSRREQEERLSRSTVGEVRRSMFLHVNLLKRTMNLYSCLVFWETPDKKALRILECVTDSDDIVHRQFGKREGAVGAVMQSGRPLIQKDMRVGNPSIPYYETGSPVTDFLAVPIRDGNAVRGVLCGDRVGGHPFTREDRAIFLEAVESLVQIVANERVFVQLERAKTEQGCLLRASECLSRALGVKDVSAAALDATALVVPYDMAALALVEGKSQRIVQVRGEGARSLEGLRVSIRSGLAGSVCRTGHYLPYKGQFDPKQQVVYTKEQQGLFVKMASLLVLPIASGEEILGTLLLACRSPHVFSGDVRTTLQVMANQLGTKIHNAKMVTKLEEMATTDGLTGLPNHRSFQEELTRQIAHTNRYGTPTSVILCDVDKFKSVNDTYGHTVGDLVLKALGATLQRIVVRDTDMPARYGGEEFVVICGGTDTRGAVQLAERVRKDLESQVFQTEKGELRCTISMGVATYPLHARSKETLIERADLALYAAKRGGRNQVRIWEPSMTK